jgi:hypothetical protein
LPGFIGPFPSTSLDESRYHCTYKIVWVLLIVGKYTKGTQVMSRFLPPAFIGCSLVVALLFNEEALQCMNIADK